ncbi:MAG: EF-hand domain-containing protein [Lysobacter sp.]|nr:EF-hand domain-containing protein [Lysobacter sp.]
MTTSCTGNVTADRAGHGADVMCTAGGEGHAWVRRTRSQTRRRAPHRNARGPTGSTSSRSFGPRRFMAREIPPSHLHGCAHVWRMQQAPACRSGARRRRRARIDGRLTAGGAGLLFSHRRSFAMFRPVRTASLLLLGAFALPVPLLAHPPGGMPDDMFATMDADHDGRISAQEHAAAAQAMFARMEANHDGYVTVEEMEAAHANRGDMQQDMQAPHDAAASASAGAPVTGAANRPAAGADRMPASGGMHHDMGMRDHFKAMDADGDGRISASEHVAGAARMFAAMDSNHDGYLSRAEFDAGHAAMMHGDMQREGMRPDASDRGDRRSHP